MYILQWDSRYTGNKRANSLMVKQSTHNRLSVGSIPTWPTIVYIWCKPEDAGYILRLEIRCLKTGRSRITDEGRCNRTVTAPNRPPFYFKWLRLAVNSRKSRRGTICLLSKIVTDNGDNVFWHYPHILYILY